MAPTHAYSWTVVIPSPSRLENHLVVQELRIFAMLSSESPTSQTPAKTHDIAGGGRQTMSREQILRGPLTRLMNPGAPSQANISITLLPALKNTPLRGAKSPPVQLFFREGYGEIFEIKRI
jgi:hypothetical protein